MTYGGRLYTALVTHTAHPGAGWNPASTPSLGAVAVLGPAAVRQLHLRSRGTRARVDELAEWPVRCLEVLDETLQVAGAGRG